MPARTAPPFRADHVGSLLRPPALLAARERRGAGEIDDEALREVEDASIRDAVALQREAGLQSATDGEFRRTAWHMDFIYQLEGVDRGSDNIKVHFRNADGELDFTTAALQVHEKVRLGHTIFGDAFTFLRETVGDGVTPKLTIPSPSMVH
jgi:5-methyltetrahydropteroyltriglutamate--homocysteine methyltransferase